MSQNESNQHHNSRQADVSALMDHALDRDIARRVLDRLNHDASMQATWHRYHAIGDALRNVPVLTGNLDISAGVMRALADEPTVLSPKPRAWQSRVILAAVAASVAGIAVVGLQQRVQGINSEIGAPLAVATIPLDLPAPRATGLPAASAVDAERLQRYLMNHNELRAVQTVRPLSPQASLVGYSPQGVEPAPEPAR